MSYPRKTVKAAANSIKDIDLGKRTAVTAFATYNTRDRDRDRANKGMFSKSWKEFSDVRIFLNHDKTQAPGRLAESVAKSMWEDNNHAYANMWFGTHTLGNDTLKMMDEGIITDSSYYFLPTKWDKFADGGYDYKEAFLKEVSVLTHWGAHPESKIVSVSKAAGEIDVASAILKQLNTDEVDFIRNFIGEMNDNLLSLATFSATLPETSDIYSWVNSVLVDLSYIVARFKDRLVYGQKSWSHDELSEHLSKLKSFARNSTASDETLQKVIKEAENIESLLLINSTPNAKEQRETSNLDSQESQLHLLNMKLLLS